MNNHITLLIHLPYIIMGKTEKILNYICTFGLTEGESTNVTHKRVQISVNSTRVLFIYLYAQGTACVKLHLYPLQQITIKTQIIMDQSVFSSLSRCDPSSQDMLLCQSPLEGSFSVISVLIFRRCFFLQDIRRRSRPPNMVLLG
jgi:hypothetical protein